MDLIRAMKIDASFAPPPDPTNAFADDPAAVQFGKALFGDRSLSPGGEVSCSKCHDRGLELQDGMAQSIGVAKVDRNSPAIALASHARWQFWDGRAETLWAQALGPFEDAREFGGSRLFVAHRIADSYASQYSALFGSDPKAINALPANGKPGDAAYDALSPDDKDKVTRIFVNVGKAIAAFERAIRVKPNTLDAYAGGDMTALSAEQKHSLGSFFVNGCAQCHWGPRLTDDAFHVLRFPTGRQDHDADTGRADGLARLAASEFQTSSKWSDAPAMGKTYALSTAATGAFKTPTLRGVATSAPYGHGGTLGTLADVAAHYSTRGIPEADSRAVGHTEDWVPIFDHGAANDLPPFLEILTAPVVLP
jgi:cytochrome c peroxidase